MLRPAFTLIELLVVVTIIVVLLALLTPALDRAIYSAELAVCGAHLNGTATSVQTYAATHRRYYPHRKLTDNADGGTFWTRPDYLQDPTKSIDDRPAMVKAVDLKLLVCPLAGEVDLANTKTDSHVHSTVALRFGFKFDIAGGGPGMFKLGDKLTWGDRRYGVLAHDWEIVGFSSNIITSTHPDRDGVLRQSVVQDTGDRDFRYVPGAGDDAVRFTFARWQSPSTWRRGPAEYNFAYDDGSVRFMDGVIVGDAAGNKPDERMAKVPVGAHGEAWTGGAGGWWSHLPRQ